MREDGIESHPAPEDDGRAPEAIWIRVVLWGLMLMVLAGLGAVWWTASRDRSGAGPEGGAELPVVSEIPPFELRSQRGESVARGDLAGRPWIVDLIFTRCQLSCPRMTETMSSLGPSLPRGVRRVSVTTDPEFDRPEVLADYARSRGIDPDEEDWLFLTGEQEEIRRLVTEGLLLGYERAKPEAGSEPDQPIVHSTRFVLVDADARVRGYYDAFEEEELDRLTRDARSLASSP
ncbi:MAG: SCO family protein [Thermoanaerobaculia bacterium]|nr:SCO family protein [Thermoanaerobaculia bacterium]